MSPLLWSAIFSGWEWVSLSQIDAPLPCASQPPSIWYADDPTPNEKSDGNDRVGLSHRLWKRKPQNSQSDFVLLKWDISHHIIMKETSESKTLGKASSMLMNAHIWRSIKGLNLIQFVLFQMRIGKNIFSPNWFIP